MEWINGMRRGMTKQKLHRMKDILSPLKAQKIGLRLLRNHSCLHWPRLLITKVLLSQLEISQVDSLPHLLRKRDRMMTREFFEKVRKGAGRAAEKLSERLLNLDRERLWARATPGYPGLTKRQVSVPQLSVLTHRARSLLSYLTPIIHRFRFATVRISFVIELSFEWEENNSDTSMRIFRLSVGGEEWTFYFN